MSKAEKQINSMANPSNSASGNAPLISVVVPCYNVEEFVEQCVRSVMAQTLQDIEIICVNDGSVDGTLHILEGLQHLDSRICIINKQNTGYGNSMNVGIAAAKGQYLAILESDDFMDPDALATLYALAERHNVDIAKANFFRHWTDPERNELVVQWDLDKCQIPFAPKDNRWIFFTQPTIWAALYKTAFIKDNNIVLNETPGASFQDASFYFETLFKAGSIMLCEEAFVHYRQDNATSSINSSDKTFCIYDEYARMFALVDQIADEAERHEWRKLLGTRMVSDCVWNYQRMSPQLGLEFLKRMQQEYRQLDQLQEIDWESLPKEWRIMVRNVIQDPVFYHMTQNDDSDETGVKRTLQRYYRAGGMRYLNWLVKYKLEST